ncbi:PEG3 [Symbiodinium sp. CCMP2592]|nr:PEG3 [Symbiodinium sp. CCMP2592]
MASTSDAWAAKMSVEDLVKGAKATADLAGLEFALDTSFLSREALLQAIQATAAPSPLLAVKNEPVKDTQQLPPLLAQPVAASTGIQDTQLEQDTFAAAPETAAEDIGVDASQGPDSQTTEPGKEPAADTRADPGPSEQPTVRAANSEPADTGPSKEPTVRAANSEPADTGPSKEPTDTGPNKEPADTGPSKEPADTGPSKEPTDTGPSKEPADTGPNQHSSDTCAGKDWPADNRAGPNKPGAIQPAEAISAHAISSRHTARPNKKPKHPWSLHRRFAVAGKDQGQASPAATSAQAAAPAPAAVAEDEDEEEPEEQDDQIGKVMVTSPDGTIVLTQDALRMRLKRMCEQKKKSHKCHVDNETHEQYASGGPQREWLEMALLEALQDVGTVALGRGKAAHKQVQASFKVRVTQIRERQMLKESETNGEWLTEEKMNKSGEYSKKWKYDNSVTEYFVEISTKQTIKHSELLKRIENMEQNPGDMPMSLDAPAMVDESKAQPKPEQVGDKTLPDLVKLMDSVHGHMASIAKLQKTISDSEDGPKLPPAKADLMKDLDRIDKSFQDAFNELAKVKAELMICESETMCLQKVISAKDTIKKPLVLLELKKSLKRPSDHQQAEPKKNPRKKK